MSNNEQLKSIDQIKGLSAQLEAAKQMVNESLQSILQLKTNFNLLQQAYNELHANNSNLVKEFETVKSKPQLEEVDPA